jgi:hypothetical protein
MSLMLGLVCLVLGCVSCQLVKILVTVKKRVVAANIVI